MLARRWPLLLLAVYAISFGGRLAVAQEDNREVPNDPAGKPVEAAEPSAASPGEASSPGKVSFFDDFATAQAAKGDERPIVLLFGASWCGWCRKLKDETISSPEVAALGPRLGWVEIDVDDEPDLAARYKARGLPHIVVVKRSGEEIASRTGFLRGPAFTEFLNHALDPNAAPKTPADGEQPGPAEPTPAEVAARTAEQIKHWQAIPPGEATPDQAREVVALLARPDRAQREAALTLLKSWGETATPVLVASLEDERLSVRAAAAQALPLLTSMRLPFDPFASREAQLQQAAAWRKELNVAPAPAVEPAALEAPDASETPAAPGSVPE